MKLSQFDLFSSEFYFNLEGQNFKKGTIQGVLLTLTSITLILSYFGYLFNQYLNNSIDPQFRSQSFITSTRKEIPLSEDLLGFNFYYNTSLTLNQYQTLKNKTYLVFVPFFYYQDKYNNIYQQINLNLTQCHNPQLQGQNCIDMQQISNYTLLLDYSNSIISQIFVNIYGCLDLDNYKTTIPDNCADQSEIDDVINGSQAGFSMFLKAQQFNTTSKQIQTNYRFVEMFSTSAQFISSQLKTQMQKTDVKQGLIFQEQQTYYTPIQYDQTIQTFDRKISLQSGLGPYIQITIYMDEIVQFTQIQYPAITQILALANSISFIAIICRIIARFISQSFIKQDFFILIMRILFQDKCLQVLQNSNLIRKSDLQIQISKKEEDIPDDILEFQNKTNLILPNFQTEFLQKKKNVNFYQDNNNSIQKQKQFLEEESEQLNNTKLFLGPDSINSLKTLQYRSLNFTNVSRFDKIDVISQNESQKSTTMKSYLNTKQIQSPVKKKSVSKYQPEISKDSNIKVDLQNLDKCKTNKAISDSISEKLKAMNHSSMNSAIQRTIFKFRCFKVKEYLSSQGIDQKSLVKMQKEVCKSLNIYELYKDIIFLKKAISMILSLDQIAAIQLIGLTDNYTNLDLESQNSKVNYENVRKKLHHFEKYYSILQCEQLQIDYIQKFLTKCQEDEDLSVVDSRILSSIIQNI